MVRCYSSHFPNLIPYTDNNSTIDILGHTWHIYNLKHCDMGNEDILFETLAVQDNFLSLSHTQEN